MGNFGRDDMMAVAAVRYCLGRMTYIAGDCCDWLPQVWGQLQPGAQNVIKRDIEDMFARDDEARRNGDQYKPLGMDMDRARWERVRKLWA